MMKIQKWNIDPLEGQAEFKVKKLMVNTITGQMEVFEGQAETETDNFEMIKRICFKASIDSIKTDDPKRDEHLKSADFFNMEEYPYLLFVAENISIEQKQIRASLKVKDITKPVVLNVDFTKSEKSDDGSEKVAAQFFGRINRRDFGLTWDGKNEVGDIIVGDQIKLYANLSFNKQTASTPIEAQKECVL